MEDFPMDPRQSELTENLPLPCGQESCNAHDDSVCSYAGVEDTGKRFLLCSADLLQIAGESFKKKAALYKGKVNSLATDPVTRLLTPAARDMILADITDAGLLEKMSSEGWSMVNIYMDMNKLKQFNELGGDKAGNAALQEMGSILKNLFKRRGDITYLAGYRQLTDMPAIAHNAIADNKPHDVLARHGGDEMVGYLFVPPAIQAGEPIMAGINIDSEKRQPQQEPLNEMVDFLGERLVKALTESKLVLEKKADIGENSIMKDGLALEYKDIEDGKVEVSLSAIVSVVISPVPATIEQIHQLTEMVETKLKKMKCGRTAIKTEMIVEYVDVPDCPLNSD